MDNFLGIREAADYLSVEYKTIYRLVRSGELPAGKIGGVYRIRKEDIDAYWARQAGVEHARPVVEHCHACGEPMASRDFVGGQCDVCGAPICKVCWQLDDAHLCSDHADMATEEAEPAAEAPPPASMLRCSYCSRVIADPAHIAGHCQEPACDEPLCRTCQDAGEHYCRAHAPTASQKLEMAREQLARGEISVLVPRGEAKRREINFINRFDRKILSIDAVRNPISGAICRVDRWDTHHETGDDTGRLMELLRTGYLERQISDTMPFNLRSLYRVADGKTRKGEPATLLIEARVVSHLESHLRDGFDARPMGVDELLPMLNEARRDAEATQTIHILGLASTSGWDQDARHYVAAPHSGESFNHRLLLPCLIDLVDHALIVNPADPRLESFAALYSLKMFEEEVADTVKYLRDATWVESVTLSQAMKRLAVDERVVQEAFRRLAGTDEYNIDEINGLGTVISRAE
jgi:excisionase family DNA binding protein